MNYLISNAGVVNGAFGKKKEAEQKHSALGDAEKLEHAVYTKAEGLLALSTESLIVLHNDLTTDEFAITGGDVVVEDLIKTVWDLLEQTYNPKVQEKAAAKAAKEAAKAEGKGEPKPRQNYKGRTITAGDVAFDRRDGTWTAFMVKTTLECATTDEASAKVAEHPEFGTAGKNKTPDFAWMVEKGFIVVGPAPAAPEATVTDIKKAA